MPIYEYQCQDCAEEIEVLQKLSDAPLEECPACGKPALKKKISAAAFRLKGSGWYETDFKTGNKKNLAGDSAAGSGEGGSSESSSGSSSDSSSGSSSEKAGKSGDSGSAAATPKASAKTSPKNEGKKSA